MASDPDQPSSVIVKSDRAGRTRYTAQYKREVLAAFRASSLSAPVFASQCGIKYPTFAAWVATDKRGGLRAGSEPVRPAFVLAEFAAPADDAGLEIRLIGGAVARLAEASQIPLLAALLRKLA